jgi:hypothetical protein
LKTLFIVYFANAAKKRKKREKKVLLLAGVSKSTAHTVSKYSVEGPRFQLLNYLGYVNMQIKHCVLIF